MEKQSNKNQRQLKVYESFRPLGHKYASEPEIRLKGKWLKELGFAPGQSVLIKHELNKIVITLKQELA